MENYSICLRAKYVKKAKVVALLMMGKCDSTLHVGGIFSEFPKVAMATLLSYFSQTGSMEILKALNAADRLWFLKVFDGFCCLDCYFSYLWISPLTEHMTQKSTVYLLFCIYFCWWFWKSTSIYILSLEFCCL